MLETLFKRHSKDEVHMVVFGIGKNLYAVDIYEVERIINWIEPTPMPNMSDGMLGVVNDRGNLIPLVSLNSMVNDGYDAESSEKQILITLHDGRYIGIEVNGNMSIIRVNKENVSELPELAKRKTGTHYLYGLIKKESKDSGKNKNKEDEIIGILNLDAITTFGGSENLMIE